MTEGPSREEEEKVIEKVAQVIVNRGIDQASLLFLDAARIGWPVTYMTGQIGTLFAGPIIAPFFGDWYKWGFTFQKKENLEKLINRVEGLVTERDRAERERKEQSKSVEKKPKTSWFRHFKS